MSARSLRVWEEGDTLCLKFTADDSTSWQHLLQSFKRYFPTSNGNRFRSSDKSWTMPRYRYQSLREWAARHFNPDEMVWPDEGYYQRRREQSYERGYSSTSSGLTDAYKTLHLLPSAPSELVQAAHRTLALLHHPDRGGDHAAMVAINQAIDLIKEMKR